MIARTRPRTVQIADRGKDSRKDTKHGWKNMPEQAEASMPGHKVLTTISRPQPILAFYHLVFFHFFRKASTIQGNSGREMCKGRPGFFCVNLLHRPGPYARSSHVIGHNVYLEVIRGAICSCLEHILRTVKKNDGDKIPERKPVKRPSQ